MYNSILFLHFCNKKEKTDEIDATLCSKIYMYIRYWKDWRTIEENQQKEKKHVRIKRNKNKIYETFSQHFLFYNYSSIHRVK